MLLSNRSPYAGLVGVIFTLVAIGLVVGITFSQVELLNPHTSAAKAALLDLDVQKEALKLEAEREIQAARVEAEQEKLALDLEAKGRKLEQNLHLARVTRYVLLSSGVLGLLMVSFGLTVYLIRYKRDAAPELSQDTPTARTWQDPTWRAEQIRQARERERRRRKSLLTHQTSTKVYAGGNGKSHA